MPYKDFTDILKANGFKYDRSKGGHEVWERQLQIACQSCAW